MTLAEVSLVLRSHPSCLARAMVLASCLDRALGRRRTNIPPTQGPRCVEGDCFQLSRITHATKALAAASAQSDEGIRSGRRRNEGATGLVVGRLARQARSDLSSGLSSWTFLRSL